MGNPAQPGQAFMSLTNPALGTFGDQTGIQFFSKFIPSLIQLVLVAGSVIFFFIFAIGAIQWITSGGDKGSLEQARNKITNSLIGIVLLFSTWAVLLFVGCFFGIGLTQITIGPLNVSLSGTVVCGGSNGGTTGGGPGGGPGGPGGTTGNALCGGCINGLCGISGRNYLGGSIGRNGSLYYTCDATNGWVNLPTQPANVSTTCGACN